MIVPSAVGRYGEEGPGVGEAGGVVGVHEGDPGQAAGVRGPAGEDHPVRAPPAILVGVARGGHRAWRPGRVGRVAAVPAVRVRGRRFDGQRRLLVGRAVGGVTHGVVGALEDGVDTDRPAHRRGEPVQGLLWLQTLPQLQRAQVGGRGEGLERPGIGTDRGLRGADHRRGRGEAERGPGQHGAQRPAPFAPTVSPTCTHSVLPRRANCAW